MGRDQPPARQFSMRPWLWPVAWPGASSTSTPTRRSRTRTRDPAPPTDRSSLRASARDLPASVRRLDWSARTRSTHSRTGAAIAGPQALEMAGISIKDISQAQLYDCYTFTVLVTLEDYGFCEKGEGGPFAASGALAPGGSLPTNTGGGQLSGYYLWGTTPLSEAVIQARGQGGERQAPNNDFVLVSGNGGVLDFHGTLVLSPHARTERCSRA